MTDLLFLELKEFFEPATLALATVGEHLAPHVAPVYFAADDSFNLYFFSDPLSQHGLDLARDARAAVTIYPETTGWQEIRGLQLRGEARQVMSGRDWEVAWQLYQAKFPFVSELRQILAENQLYVFIPTWMRLVDNARGFGYKAEWERRNDEGDTQGSTSAWQAYDPGAAEIGGAGG